jgi:hypothetical protein
VDKSLVKMILAQKEASPFANWQNVGTDEQKQLTAALVGRC